MPTTLKLWARYHDDKIVYDKLKEMFPAGKLAAKYQRGYLIVEGLPQALTECQRSQIDELSTHYSRPKRPGEVQERQR